MVANRTCDIRARLGGDGIGVIGFVGFGLRDTGRPSVSSSSTPTSATSAAGCRFAVRLVSLTSLPAGLAVVIRHVCSSLARGLSSTPGSTRRSAFNVTCR